MTAQKIKLTRIICILIALAAGAYVVSYYWSVNDFGSIRIVPMAVMISLVVYVLMQLLKRYVTKQMPSYEWLYYIGLGAVVAPVFLAKSDFEWLHLLTDYGTLFLLIPPLLDGYNVVKGSKK